MKSKEEEILAKTVKGINSKSTLDREERERDDRRQKAVPWISLKQWSALDKLSTIPPFNQPNKSNMEKNLSAHIEMNAREWLIYVNDKDFLDMNMNRKATTRK